MNETDFQKGITGSSFCCKKNSFFFCKSSVCLVELSAEDTEIREEEEEILMLLDLGIAAEGTKALPNHNSRKALTETVTYM